MERGRHDAGASSTPSRGSPASAGCTGPSSCDCGGRGATPNPKRSTPPRSFTDSTTSPRAKRSTRSGKSGCGWVTSRAPRRSSAKRMSSAGIRCPALRCFVSRKGKSKAQACSSIAPSPTGPRDRWTERGYCLRTCTSRSRRGNSTRREGPPQSSKGSRGNTARRRCTRAPLKPVGPFSSPKAPPTTRSRTSAAGLQALAGGPAPLRDGHDATAPRGGVPGHGTRRGCRTRTAGRDVGPEGPRGGYHHGERPFRPLTLLGPLSYRAALANASSSVTRRRSR